MGAQSTRPEDQGTTALLVTKISALLGVVVRGLLDWRVVVSAIWAFPLVYLGWVYLLPPGDRLKASPDAIAHALVSIVESSVFAIAGWTTAAAILLVSVVVVAAQHRRIKKQGADNAALRDQLDPKRLSAGNRKALLDYASSKPSKREDDHK